MPSNLCGICHLVYFIVVRSRRTMSDALPAMRDVVDRRIIFCWENLAAQFVEEASLSLLVASDPGCMPVALVSKHF